MKRSILTAIMMALALGVGAGRSQAQASGDLLQLLPDGNAVIVVDVPKVIASSAWTSLNSQDNRFKSIVDKVMADVSELGVKLADINSAALVFQSSGWSNPTVAARGTFNQTELLDRLRANTKVKLVSEKYSEYEIHSVTRDQTGAGSAAITFVFYDSGTVVVGTASGVRASIDAKTGTKSSVAKNAGLASGIAETPISPIRFAMTKIPGLTDRPPAGDLPLPDFSTIKLIFGSLELATGLNLNATLRNDTSEQAKALAERLNAIVGIGKVYLKGSADPKMAALGNALNTIAITGSNADVKITGDLPPEVLALIFR
ncbi:MAG TPA: hypothetical protein VLD57_04530 [Blastocatellia bacterium]|nr:hypothetical protein [Blastocatellia bacterium]